MAARRLGKPGRFNLQLILRESLSGILKSAQV
jgi:hypothetical protein